MQVHPFQMDDLRTLKLQPAQVHCMDSITEDVLASHESLDAYTLRVGDEVVAVAGLMWFWEGRAMAWSYIGANAGQHMRALTRVVRDFLDHCTVRRVEAYVDPEFDAGLRWVELLGFKREGLLEGFLVDGRDQVLFARVQKHG